MTKYKKLILLFLALLLPVCIFLFLKIFGKNQFNVPPMFTDVLPENASECDIAVTLPYKIPALVRDSLSLSRDKMTIIHFGVLDSNEHNYLNSVKEAHRDKVGFIMLPDAAVELKRCVFFLADQNDLVLVDSEGTIRGQYVSSDRDEIDRLKMELSILFNEY
jgi:hypothetical protein